MRVSIILVIIFLFSCKSETIDPVAVESVQGKWLIDEAFRNNRKTGLLKNGFFNITDKTFSTNIIPDSEGEFLYSYLNNKLKLQDDDQTTYQIKELKGDTLIMNTTIGHFDFHFVTIKEKED